MLKRIVCTFWFQFVLAGLIIVVILGMSKVEFNEEDVNSLIAFMHNEEESVFGGSDVYDYSYDDTVSELLEHHFYNRLSAEIGSDIDDYVQESDRLLMDPEGWNTLYIALVPSSAYSEGGYVNNYIRTNALYDCLMCMDSTKDNYYECKCKVLEELRKYEPLLHGNVYRLIYVNSEMIYGQIIPFMFILLVGTAYASMLKMRS